MVREMTYSPFAISIGITVMLLLIWVLSRKERTANPPSTRVQYVAIPLLIEWLTPDVQAVFENLVVFLRGGEVLIGNQVFKRHEPIAITTQGVECKRNQGSDCLILISSGIPRERYMFCYRYFFLRGFAWVNLVRRIH